MGIITRRRSLIVMIGGGAVAVSVLADIPLATAIWGVLERQALLDPVLTIGMSMSSAVAGVFASWRLRRYRKRMTDKLQHELKTAYRQVVDRYLAIQETKP